MKRTLAVASLVLSMFITGCRVPESGAPREEPVSPSISEQEATLILGREARRVLFPYLRRHGIAVFHSRSAYYAFTDDMHLCIASRWDGFIKAVDFNNDGRDDFVLQYKVGSGMVRRNTTVVMDDGKRLRVYHVYGALVEQDGRWKVPHPLAYYGFGKDKATPLLRFDSKAMITVEWPQGTPENKKWSVVKEVKWSPNKPDAGDGL